MTELRDNAGYITLESFAFANSKHWLRNSGFCGKPNSTHFSCKVSKKLTQLATQSHREGNIATVAT